MSKKTKNKKSQVDTFQTYLDNHPEVYTQYQDQHIAIHPTKGIIAHSHNLKEVIERVQELNLKEEVLIDKLNSSPFIRTE